ncbi:MAG: aminotransferase class III-fold pyridoxal phosphate-dependent enzyme [Candidatus Saganbacteria bacterium]|nr:aminotransferase class III-fold pyridoxal phosphate-dependent enzyme [Candidatus Saganbacteria bacterium]
MKKGKLIERTKKVLSPVLARYFELEVKGGRGAFLTGLDGRKYLDFSTGIAVNSLGHCHPNIVEAIEKQTRHLIHVCAGIAYYEANVALAEKLKEILPAPLESVFFCQSGTEAVEGAMKLAKYVTKKPGIITFKGAFHGRTLGALSVTTSKAKYQEGYKPLLPNVYVASKDIDSFKKVVAKVGKGKIAAAIIELVQGEGGYIIQDPFFVKELVVFCKSQGILLILDEIQSGLGRTGKWFACQHFGIVPDIMCIAKSLGGGLPLGAVVSSKKIMEQWSPGAHGGTMGGNPVACAAGLAMLEVIQKQKILDNVQSMGGYLKQKLLALQAQYPKIKEVRGLGLMLGVDFKDSAYAKHIINTCLSRGLVLISTGADGQVVRFIPPLNVAKAQVDNALQIFERVLKG